VASLEREWRWLPVLAPGLTLRVPEPVALGQQVIADFRAD